MFSSLIGGLIGCGPGPLTPDEADVIYEAVASVNADLYTAFYTFSAPDREEYPPGETAEDTDPLMGFEGGVTGPGSWGGFVQVIFGTYDVTATSAESWSAVWSVDLTYAAVTFGDLELDADLHWDIATTAERSSFSHTSTVNGSFVARGAPRGSGMIEYETSVSLAGGRYRVLTDGTVGGHPITSDYDAAAFAL